MFGDTNMKKNKIIVSLAYNRPGCEKQHIEHLERCNGIDSYKTIFMVEPCDCLVLDIIRDSRLNKEIIVNDTLRGLWPNKKCGVEKGLEESDFVIVLEDDVLLAKDALEYFEWANKTFRLDTTVKTISAYHNLKGEPYHQGLSHRVEKRHWYNSTAWAIWKDRYELLNNWTGEDKNLMNQLFASEDSYEVFPLLSRAQNVGHVNGVNSPAKELLSVVGLENSYATIGLSRNATKDNILFTGDEKKYCENIIKKTKIDSDQILVDQAARCMEYSFENQLIINELGQEYVKLDSNHYKSRDNKDYKDKYYLDCWAETVVYKEGEFHLECQ